MANDLTALATEAQERFVARLAASHSAWRALVPVNTGTPDADSIKATDLTGIGGFSAQAADGAAPTANTLSSSGTAYSDTLYESRTVLTDHQLMKNPGIISEIAAEAADGAAKTINSLVWSALATLDVTPHPDQSVTGAGGTPYVADVFSAPVVQSTLKTTALGASALTAAVAELMSHKNKDGIPIDPTSSPLFLVVPPALAQTARQLAGRSGEILDGTSLQDGGWPGLDASRVLVNLDAADANDWGLFAGGYSPIRFWLTQQPTFRVQPYPGAGRLEIYSSVAGGVYYTPAIGGFVFSKVA